MVAADSPCFIGVDVGTGSARAGVFTKDGAMLGCHTHAIRTWKPKPDFVEQSSEDIWQACVTCIREAMVQAGVAPKQVQGLGFDATCSLVVLDGSCQPLTISPTRSDEQNVMVWMDHRAMEQAKRINSQPHEVMKYVGGSISLEMETPKLLWLKEQLPETFGKAAHFFDLPDFLTWRATGDFTRSLCSSVCKWTYLGHATAQREGTVGSWDPTYFEQVGLQELLDNKAQKIGSTMRPLGEAVGKGLTEEAATSMGLLPGTPVSTSAIDAHAGGIGVLGAGVDGLLDVKVLERRVALIGGTSTCHMAVSKDPCYIPGVWGPYFSAMVPDFWLSEGGQSATGALLDHVIFTHATSAALQERGRAEGKTVYELLNEELRLLAASEGVAAVPLLAMDVHVLPYFHGNRSPRADPLLTGAAVGLRLRDTVQELAVLYLATIQAIALGTRHIIEEMNDKGYQIDTIMACGGGTKNPVWMQEHANATGCAIILPREPEAVLLGGAMLGAVAGGQYTTITAAMSSMSQCGTELHSEPALKDFYNRKYAVFLEMYNDHQKYRKMMRG
uniref:FGGY carbohydrate kinase domain-containing protein n=1 Tax=Eutreptiella gymnastica TaxID=73025 RepID=A0A7S1NPH0_9EUGL